MIHAPSYHQVQAREGPAFLEAIAAFIEERKEGKQQQPPRVSYKDAGVDIDAGNALVERIKPACKSTKRPGCDSDLGGFGGLFDLSAAGYSDGKDTVLVGATDGVGTKLKVTSCPMSFVSCRNLLLSFLHINYVVLFFISYAVSFCTALTGCVFTGAAPAAPCRILFLAFC